MVLGLNMSGAGLLGIIAMRKANESRESRDVSEFGIKSSTCIFKYTYQCV